MSLCCQSQGLFGFFKRLSRSRCANRVTAALHFVQQPADSLNVAGQLQLRGAHVVLVDDVITTAATINACAQALADGGARIISCVTFGRAPEPGDRAVSDYDLLRN